MHLGELINRDGTDVSCFECDECGVTFTICPAIPKEERALWNVCLAETCDSYDPARDCDVFFMSDEEIVTEKPIEHLAALLTRPGPG